MQFLVLPKIAHYGEILVNVQVLRLPIREVHPNRSSLILGLLHLAVREDVLSCILHNLALIARELPCGNFSLKDLVQLFETAALGLWHEEIVPDDTKEVRPCPDVGVLGTLSLVNMSCILVAISCDLPSSDLVG
jgi:hypothetical protein